jgi:hypothetical protein
VSDLRHHKFIGTGQTCARRSCGRPPEALVHTTGDPRTSAELLRKRERHVELTRDCHYMLTRGNHYRAESTEAGLVRIFIHSDMVIPEEWVRDLPDKPGPGR